MDELPIRTFERLKDVTLLVEEIRNDKQRRANG